MDMMFRSLSLLFLFVFLSFFGLSYGNNILIQESYRRLGLSIPSELKTVRAAYRTLSLQYHPDKNPTCLLCPKKMQEINAAYEIVLQDIGSRVKSRENKISSELFLIIRSLKESWNKLPETERRDILDAIEHYLNYSKTISSDLAIIVRIFFPLLFEGLAIILTNPIALFFFLSYNLCAFLGFLLITWIWFKVIHFFYVSIKFLLYELPKRVFASITFLLYELPIRVFHRKTE